MTVTTTALEVANDEVLNFFDNFSHIAVGDGTAAFDVSQTALANEFLRRVIESTDKDLSNNTYEIVMRVPITKGNSNTFAEVAIFDASSGGNMGFRELFAETFTKTSDDEVIIKLEVSPNAQND